MKTSWTALFVVTIAAFVDDSAASCSSACQSQLVHFREEACQKWREVLPRPDLFNHCGEGFNKGKFAGCEGFCQENPDLGTMTSLRLDACGSLKGMPPQERQQSCQAGFSAALDLAKDAAIFDNSEQDATAAPTQAATAASAAASTQGSQGNQDAGIAAGRKFEEAGAPKEKRKATVKNVIPEDGRRNLLEEARNEAEAAFAAEAKVEL